MSDIWWVDAADADLLEDMGNGNNAVDWVWYLNIWVTVDEYWMLCVCGGIGSLTDQYYKYMLVLTWVLLVYSCD